MAMTSSLLRLDGPLSAGTIVRWRPAACLSLMAQLPCWWWLPADRCGVGPGAPTKQSLSQAYLLSGARGLGSAVGPVGKRDAS